MRMAVISSDSDPVRRKRWTAADLRQIPDDRHRYEIIDGELFVTPAPSLRHQEISARIFMSIRLYLEANRIGNVVFAPADVVLADDTVVEPDVFVVPLVDGKPPERWEDVGRLLLAIEILSPSTARADRTVKRLRYQREGAPEYWIVDGDARIVERWGPEDERPEIVTEKLQWWPDQSLPPLVIDLAVLFEA
jgi:Uma2 family endonuclease